MRVLYEQINKNVNDITYSEFINMKISTKISWICDKGHEFYSTINKRKMGSGCPYCSNNKIMTGFNDLATTHPELLKEWDYDKNSMLPNEIFPGTKKKYWWKCQEGHSYDMSPLNKKYGQSCPYCSGKRILIGFNDLASQRKDLIKEWDYNKNIISPEEVTEMSAKKVWWRCQEGHSWIAKIYNRTANKSGCPICYHPNNAIYLDKDSNNFKENIIPFIKDKTILEKNISRRKNIIFTCNKGHEYARAAYIQLRNKKCPICNKEKSNNELLSVIDEWDHNKNDKSLYEYLSGSGSKVWWKCKNNHSYKMSIHRKAKEKQNCPICNNKKILKGYNDLETTHSKLLKEWDFTKNKILPEEISAGSVKKVWWKCNKGHSWRTAPNNRTRKDGKETNCPKCSNNISKSEQELFSFIKEILPNNIRVINNTKKVISPYELDIYFPDLKIAIEYNGVYWHSENKGKDKNYHYHKWLKCQEKGIQLITVWEDDWLNKQEIVKNLLLHKLGLSQQDKIYARKTYIDFIDKTTAREFCNANHIQGYTTGSVYIGLRVFKTQELVGMAIYKKNAGELKLERYCTSKKVIGGMGKLLKAGLEYAKENDCNKLVTFSDHEVSDGGLYEKLGFISDKELKPDYKYVYDHKRVHKFNFRLKRFKNDPELEYDSSMTERELAVLNNIPRVWDCGKTRWVIDL